MRQVITITLDWDEATVPPEGFDLNEHVEGVFDRAINNLTDEAPGIVLDGSRISITTR